jgi:2,3-bisphosphoglycerate-dependent phosphoglycerate mutase
MLTATRLIAVRHGETAWNVDTRLQGQLDIPLNEHGLQQAQRAAVTLADEAPDVIYSSDLCRAHATAQALGHRIGLPVHTDPGLRERHFGQWQGHTYAEVERQWPELAVGWRTRDPAFGPPGGETLSAFFDRCVSTLTRLAQAHPGQTVVVVAHGGVLDCFYRAANHMALNAARTWELPNTGINRLLYTGSGFRVTGWADVSHLEEWARDESADRVGHAA